MVTHCENIVAVFCRTLLIKKILRIRVFNFVFYEFIMEACHISLVSGPLYGSFFLSEYIDNPILIKR